LNGVIRVWRTRKADREDQRFIEVVVRDSDDPTAVENDGRDSVLFPAALQFSGVTRC